MPCSNSSIPSSFYNSDLPGPHATPMHDLVFQGVHANHPKAYGQGLSSKSTSASAYTWGYSDDSSIDGLNLQGSTYGHPQVPDQVSHFYGPIETSRNWSSVGSWMGSGQPISYEKNAHGSTHVSGGNAAGGRLPSVTCEGVSPLSMTSLHSSLPVSASLEARQLPMPMRNQSISSSSSIAPTARTSSDQGGGRARLSSHYSNPNLSAVNGGPIYRNYSGSNWTAASSISESRRSSLNNQPTSTLMPPPIPRPSLASRSSHSITDVPGSNMGHIGYIALGMAGSERPGQSNVSSLNYSSSSPSGSYVPFGSHNPRHSAPTFTSGLQGLSIPHDSLFTRSSSPPPTATATLYSYSTDTGSKSDNGEQDAAASGTLISGQKYAPLQQPPSRRGSSADTLHENELSRGVQRETVSNLGSRY